MASLRASPTTSLLAKGFPLDSTSKTQFDHHSFKANRRNISFDHGRNGRERRRALGKRSLYCWSTAEEVGVVGKEEGGSFAIGGGQDGYLVREFGWGVRRMAQVGEEMRRVAYVQAEAFHVPMALFNDLFFEFFRAEVLSALIYRIRNSPPERYACLVAEPADVSNPLRAQVEELVGVVDATVQKDDDVLRHLEDAEEYIYVSGIAVLRKFRRQKIATALLRACDALADTWGYDNLALRVYEEDSAARKLYSNAGYKVISKDPVWVTWIGKKRRVLMIKRSAIL
ncbi:GCN5-related N-acetyltransferase 10, chloroplastic isoform X2 [Typha angustifolia]|uniref:GCN5-related N-acetyltransferase 10, chloroplastic n=1 Tax=Typha latifolia TaxID=4733 RepID=UPI003C2B6487